VQEEVFKNLVEYKLITGYKKENDSSYIIQYDGSEESRKKILQYLSNYNLRSFYDSALGLEEAYLKLISGE